MAIETQTLTIGGMSIDLVRKSIKNLHLAVYPPDGRVRIAAPWHVSDDAVRLAVATRVAWINRQKRKFLAQARQTERRFVSGETHYFLGRGYRLVLLRNANSYRIKLTSGNRLELRTPAEADQTSCERALGRWYRKQLRQRAEVSTSKWANRIGIDCPAVGIKRMRTKWGTCNPAGQRIWLNLELAKKPPHCIDYIVLHELLHFQHRTHGEAFVETISCLMPNWRSIRAELNSLPLGHETWAFKL
ncbi:M48 family metallopeptidase [Blastomonas fulva]|jgi:predicted metal-dependent hydrolase|uniref:M48 family metallopeptidase n=1 Tax=Blastomonas fulva TaxID=1550728 RepID=UPI003D2C7B80